MLLALPSLAVAVLVANLLILLLLVWLLLRKPVGDSQGTAMLRADINEGHAKLEREVRPELGDSSRTGRLEQLYKGLYEMQALAVGVGSLQRMLTNVKTRGIFGKVQLEVLLAQVSTTVQYARQVETKPRSGQSMEFCGPHPRSQR